MLNFLVLKCTETYFEVIYSPQFKISTELLSELIPYSGNRRYQHTQLVSAILLRIYWIDATLSIVYLSYLMIWTTTSKNFYDPQFDFVIPF